MSKVRTPVSKVRHPLLLVTLVEGKESLGEGKESAQAQAVRAGTDSFENPL